MQKIESCFQEAIEVFQNSKASIGQDIVAVANSCLNVISKGKKILFCGNGGSAVDAQHLATELVVRLDSTRVRAPIAALALTGSMSNITAIGNDFSFDDIFSRQIEALGNKGDLLVAMSTSGNSINIVKALKKASSLGLSTVLFSSKTGGKAAKLADLTVLVPSKNVMRIQEVHLFAGHTMIQLLEELLLGSKG